MEANNDQVHAELSFQQTSQVTTDDAQGIIDAVAGWNNLVTSGMSFAHLNKVCNGLYVPVGVGQIVYLNTSITGAAQVKVIMHVMER
jgi:hypothetical protein